MALPILLMSLWLTAQDSLTIKDIPAAERAMGLQFTPAERDSLFGNVKGMVQDFSKMRQYPLDNSTPLSTWQSPVLPGMVFNTQQKPVQWIISNNVAKPVNKNDLAYYSILQLAALIKNKKISSVELTRFFIERLKKWGDTLQCVISLTEEIALQQAMQADKEIAAGHRLRIVSRSPTSFRFRCISRGTVNSAFPLINELSF